MWQRLMAVARKEFIQIRRDKRTLAMMIVLPIIWLVMFGYAFSFDVQEIRVGLVDESTTPMGGLVGDAFRNYERFRLIPLDDPSEAGIREAIHRDEIQMGILIPATYGESSTAELQVLLDGSDLFGAQTAARLLQLALGPVQQEVEVAMMAKIQAGMRQPTEQIIAPPKLIPAMEILYNPELKSANVMIPGLLGMVLMFITTLMTALGVVREREYGTLEQLVVTPVRPFELMLGKLLPYFLIAAVDFGLVFVAGTYLFGLTFAGNLPAFLALSLLLVFTTLGMGLLISTLAQNQQQAMQMVLLLIMPQFVLSGLIFPLSSMPTVIQYIAHLLPFTYFVPIARGMFIKGQGLELLLTPTLILAAYAIAMVTLASLRFRKRLG